MKLITKEALALALAVGLGGAEAQMVQPTATDGDCLMDVSLQAEGETPNGVPTNWHPDNNIIVKLAGDACDVGVSPTWTVAGWDYTIVQIAPGSEFNPPAIAKGERQLVKLIRGSLVNANYNGIYDGEKWETHVATVPNRAIPMYIDSSIDAIKVGDEGAVIVYIKVTEDTLATPVTDMAASPATDIAGPFSENLVWNSFNDLVPPEWIEGGMDFVEFYNLAGILLQDNDGSRLNYMQFWTVREDMDVDGGHHNHADLTTENAFAEIHMATYVANGVAGMQATLPNTKNLNYVPNPDDTSGFPNQRAFLQNDQTEVQWAIPLPPGFSHGPMWSVDHATGEPTRLCSGGVVYPYHRWLTKANGEFNSPLRYSMWVAFEHLPEDATVPQKMLTEWPNAYLASTMPGCGEEEEDHDNDHDMDEDHDHDEEDKDPVVEDPVEEGEDPVEEDEDPAAEEDGDTPSSRSLKRDSNDYFHQITLSLGGLLLAAGGFLLGN